VATFGAVDIYLKELEDGSRALGFFNRGSTPQSIEFKSLDALGFKSPQHVRDLWRQINLPDIADPSKDALKTTIAGHGALLYKLSPAK
jgi:alpha-galactosidase